MAAAGGAAAAAHLLGFLKPTERLRLSNHLMCTRLKLADIAHGHCGQCDSVELFPLLCNNVSVLYILLCAEVCADLVGVNAKPANGSA